MKTLYMAGPARRADGTLYDAEEMVAVALELLLPTFASEEKLMNGLKQGVTHTDISIVKVTIETVGA